MSEVKTTVTGRFVGGGLFTARKKEGEPEEKARFSACVILDDGQSAKVDAIVKAAITETWGSKKPAGLQIWAVREGDDPEFEASFEKEFINPKSTRAPQTLVKKGSVYQAVSEDDDLLYPGCNVAISIQAYAYKGDRNAGIKPGVSLNLRAVLFRSHGERIGDVIDAEAEFEGFSSEVEEDDDFLALDEAS